MGPGFFFSANPDLADVLGRTDFDFDNVYLGFFWKPPTCGYVAGGALFFSEKWPPDFWKPLTYGYVAAGAFFFQKKWPPDFWKPHRSTFPPPGLPG